MDLNDAELSRHRQVQHRLESAIAHQGIHLCYQAQNRLHDGQLIGLEALCRLNPHAQGLISPDEFIPVAERSNLIIALEQLVLAQVAKDLPLLLARYPDIRISVNLSAQHLTAPHFNTSIQTWLDTLPPHMVNRLDFEITETGLQRIGAKDIEGLNQLRQRGIRIVMDDFGAGQSSLSRLHRLPFDVIKLDKQFIQQIDHPMVHAIVKAAIELAQQFKLGLIAEGVETQEQCKTLQALGCQTVQGFYFGRPALLEHWLQATDA